MPPPLELRFPPSEADLLVSRDPPLDRRFGPLSRSSESSDSSDSGLGDLVRFFPFELDDTADDFDTRRDELARG